LVLKTAQLVKLNDDELAALTGTAARTPGSLAKAVRRFADDNAIARVCVTAGARGAGLWWDGQWHWEDARPVTVRDTVGAGDAFLGALLGAIFVRQARPADALAQACRMGEFVASRDGATPAYQLNAHGQPRDR
jgi:fructokinase